MKATRRKMLEEAQALMRTDPEFHDYCRDKWFHALANIPKDFAVRKSTGRPDPAWEGGLDALATGQFPHDPDGPYPVRQSVPKGMFDMVRR